MKFLLPWSETFVQWNWQTVITVGLFHVYILSCVYMNLLYQGLTDYVHYNKEFIILRFYSIHFTVIILARLKNIVHYIKDFIKYRFVKSRFHCVIILQLIECGQRNIKKLDVSMSGVFFSIIEKQKSWAGNRLIYNVCV